LKIKILEKIEIRKKSKSKKSKSPKIKNRNRKISKFDRKISKFGKTERSFCASKDCKLPMILFVGRILCKTSRAKQNLSGNSYALPSGVSEALL